MLGADAGIALEQLPQLGLTSVRVDIEVGVAAQSLIYLRRTAVEVLISIQLGDAIYGHLNLIRQNLRRLAGDITAKGSQVRPY